MSRKILFALSVLFFCSMWYYIQFILVPYQRSEAAQSGRPRGNLSDLYPRWLGSRELLLHHRDPYSPDITREVQIGYYGRPLDPQRPNDPKDQEAFAYPVYVAFLLAPLAGLKFEAVRVLFSGLLVVLTVAGVFLWKSAMRYRPSGLTLAIFLFLTLGCFPAAQGIKLQQLSLLVAALMAAGAAALAGGFLALAGFVLALVTIKPQLALPALCWLTLWTVSDWKNRRRFLISFVLTLAILVLAGEALLPGWIGKFRQAIHAYMQYTGGRSLLEQLAGPTAGIILNLLLILIAAAVCWRARSAPIGSPPFSWTLALILATTVVVIPMIAPYNQLLLLPGIMLVVDHWRQLWRKGRLQRLGLALASLLLAWPWIATSVLTVASFAIPRSSVERAWTLPLYTSVPIPLAWLAILIGPAWGTVAQAPVQTPAKSNPPAAATHTSS